MKIMAKDSSTSIVVSELVSNDLCLLDVVLANRFDVNICLQFILQLWI